MYNIRAERSAGWSGLAFLVLVIVATLPFGGAPPSWTANPATLAAFLSAHHQGLLISAWLGFPTAAFFLWFAAGIRAHLAHAAGLADGLPLYAISAAIVSVGIALAANAVEAVLAVAAIPADDLSGWWALTMLLQGPIIAMASTIFIFATAHSMGRHGSGPALLVYFGYVAALGTGASSLSMFFGAMSSAGLVLMLAGNALFAIWVIAASIWLIRSAGGPDQVRH